MLNSYRYLLYFLFGLYQPPGKLDLKSSMSVLHCTVIVAEREPRWVFRVNIVSLGTEKEIGTVYVKGPKQKAIISLEIVAYWFCMTRLFILYSYLAMRLRDCVQH